jgi:indole-3-glycerol phosphate synthase
VIRPDFDPAAIARLYHQAGASAVSVLTDTTYFQGSLEHLTQVRHAVPLPVLRKDFMIDEYQIHEARCHGADAVLLIAEVLGTGTICRFADLVADLGMTSLIEVHSSQCLDDVLQAVDFDPATRRLLGINNRDLATQQTDVAHTERLAARIPRYLPFVSESGIRTRADVERVACAGARAILVGESLLRAADPANKIRELLGALQ